MTIGYSLPNNFGHFSMKTIFITFLAAWLLGTGCAKGGPGQDGGSGERPAGAKGTRSSPQTVGGADGRLPPQLRFQGTTLDGRPFTGADLAERPVVFWFWAPWCPKCIADAPHVADVAKKYGDRVTFVGIAGLEKSREQMRRFVTHTGTDRITQLDDRAGKLYAQFKVTSVPSYVFVTAGGKVTRDFGQLRRPALENRVRGLSGGSLTAQ